MKAAQSRADLTATRGRKERIMGRISRQEPFDIDTINISIVKRVLSGSITIYEAAVEFHQAGWTGYVNEEYARKQVEEYKTEHNITSERSA